MVFTHQDIKNLIMSEVSLNTLKYINFFTTNCRQTMLSQLEQYLTKGIYTNEVCDITVVAAAKVFSVNMCIYKKQGTKAILYAQTSDPPSSRDVYLKYANEHYDAIVSCAQSNPKESMVHTPKRRIASNSANPCILSCGLSQQEVNDYAINRTYFESFTHNGEKYLVMPTNIPSTDPKLKEILAGISAWNSNIRIMQQATSVNSHNNKFLPKINRDTKPEMEDIGEDLDEDYIQNKED